MLSGLTYAPSQAAVQNKRLQAFGISAKQKQAIRAWRYWDGTAYSRQYGMQFPHPYVEWDETKNGPRPLIQPLPKIVVEQSAQFLFGEQPRFIVGKQEDTGDGSLQKLLDDIISMNQLYEKLLPEARACSIEGGRVFKYAWTPEMTKRPVAIMTHTQFHVTFDRDDLDADKINSAVLRFKYQDGQGEWWWYQEKWDEKRLTVYRRIHTTENDDSGFQQQIEQHQWPVDYSQTNPFGVIPFTAVHNRLIAGETDGYGDYWDLFGMFDQYNHKCWLEHKSDQIDIDRILVVLNDSSIDLVLPKAGDALKINGENTDAKWLEAANNMRPEIRLTKGELKQMIMRGAGYSDPNPEEITNKGNLTRAVWNLVYADSISSTREKRHHWGENGLCQFFESMLLGLSRLPDACTMYPALKKVSDQDPTTYDVQIKWGEMFKTTVEERTATITDATASITSGFLTRERATGIVADAWGIEDVAVLLEELQDQHEMLDEVDQANVDTLTAGVQKTLADAKGDDGGND